MYKILFIEDDVIMHRLLKGVLAAEGWEMVIHPRGDGALEAARKHRPDFILLDIHLPGKTGFEVCGELKTDPDTKRIPVLMVTGEARGVEQRVKGLEMGADDYLLKPFSPVELVARIRRLTQSVKK